MVPRNPNKRHFSQNAISEPKVFQKVKRVLSDHTKQVEQCLKKSLRELLQKKIKKRPFLDSNPRPSVPQPLSLRHELLGQVAEASCLQVI